MELLNIVQTNLFAFVILLLIFINVKTSYRNILFDQKLFLKLVFITLILLLIDIAKSFANGKDSLYMININLISSTLNYLLAPVTSFIWVMYVDYKIYESKLKLKRKVFILSLPIVINTFLIFLNLTKGSFSNIIFSISSSNIYSRGHYFYIVMIISYSYLFYAFIDIIKNRKKIEKKDFFHLFFFIIPPIIGGAIQALFYGVKLAWPSLTLSIFIIYINIQNKQIYLDVLTGLYNRRKLNIYLDDIIEKSRNNLIGGIMIDLDDFKNINDSFGHGEGDKALVHVANLLKYNFRKEDFLARYAGDEFLIILRVNKTSEMKNIVKRLRKTVDEFNSKNITPYNLSLSIGYDVFHPNSYITSEEFITRIDNLMYKQKELKRLIYEV